jgi:hypothetical protein
MPAKKGVEDMTEMACLFNLMLDGDITNERFREEMHLLGYTDPEIVTTIAGWIARDRLEHREDAAVALKRFNPEEVEAIRAYFAKHFDLRGDLSFEQITEAIRLGLLEFKSAGATRKAKQGRCATV